MDLKNKQKVFLIGAPKSGTTSLHYLINYHPNICLSKYKETRFFLDDELFSEGVNFFYNKYFDKSALSEKIQYIGESTPAYLGNAHIVAKRIQETFKNDDLKFIVILRNPTDRAWSNYLHRKVNLVELKSFREAVDEDINGLRDGKPIFHRYFSCGLYSIQLKAWFKCFSPSKFLILFYDELKDETKLLEKIFDFLKIPPIGRLEFTKKLNVSSQPRSLYLSSLVRNSGLGKLFRKIVPKHKQHMVRTFVRKLIKKKARFREEMPKELRDYMVRLYKSEILNLEELLSRDLSEWK
ncbi:MAG: sulfotransferase domain-containing protein [Imperialibacter sp.]|uniref:sulfotransferase domain-containing protein n=1 Tax=Imperialibacter sp. TaxID=2038411 RepID=UPI0030D936E7|tara:strand:+ start:22 stop:906 length:885 start_codon:yes stop_codon:yes gene_type:complete